jgi:hypothetical protein
VPKCEIHDETPLNNQCILLKNEGQEVKTNPVWGWVPVGGNPFPEGQSQRRGGRNANVVNVL